MIELLLSEQNLFENIRIDLINIYIPKDNGSSMQIKISTQGIYKQINDYFKTKKLDIKFKSWICNKHNIPFNEYENLPIRVIESYEKTLSKEHTKKIEQIATPKCVPSFENDNKIIKKYYPELCYEIIDYGRQGLLIEAFCGKYNICSESFGEWINSKNNKMYDDLRSAVRIAQSASIYFWNCKFIHALENIEDLGSSIQYIKSMLNDIIKTTPKGLREMQFDNLLPSDNPEELKIKKHAEEFLDVQSAFMGK